MVVKAVDAATSAGVVVQLEGVSKWFGSHQVLCDITLSIAFGERVVICGPSGSGKSTLIRCINQLESHQSGRVVVDGVPLGHDTKNLTAIRREIGMVFQHFNLFPHLTVLQNCTLAPVRTGRVTKTEAGDLARFYLDKVHILDQAEKYPGQLSGGQQQRVALARALIVSPSVLLLDEPLSNLDALLREQMRVEIRRIQKTLGITAVYVTHDRVEAMSLSDRIIVMRNGKIAQMGPPPEIYANPVSKFVAGFIGKAAFFPGKVVAVDGDCCVEVNGKTVTIPRWSPELKVGDEASVMCRPESLVLSPPGEGIVDGRVNTNIYLGNTLESFIDTEDGEILVQVDNPAGRKINAEGEAVSISIRPELAKALAQESA